MIKKVIGKGTSLTRAICSFASFKKYDHTDALNFKSLLTEEEIMVRMTTSRLAIMLASSHRRISSRECSRITGRRSFKNQC